MGNSETWRTDSQEIDKLKLRRKNILFEEGCLLLLDQAETRVLLAIATPKGKKLGLREIVFKVGDLFWVG